MCGIVGYAGKKEVVHILLDGLRRLEYRGYDSAGVAILEAGGITVAKRQGKLEFLDSSINRSHFKGTVGIGHTRWATHGEPTSQNAHPHLDCKKNIAVVHNGIIENYLTLKKQLVKEGHKFRSKTDSEVIAHLIEKYYRDNLEEALLKAINQLHGSYAIAAVCSKEPHKIAAARCGSPLIVGVGKEENFIASDVPAILTYTRNVIYLDDYEVAVLDEKQVRVFDGSGKRVKKRVHKITWDINAAEKGGYPHFMLKEIEEQPEVVEHLIHTRLPGKNRIFFEELKISDKTLAKVKSIQIVACGTAWHAGLVGKYLIERYARIPVEVDLSSEYRYRDPIIHKGNLVIAVSQSGETADTLAALRLAKHKKAKILSICNVVGSSIVRDSDGVIYTHAGPEIGVASTKAYMAQVSIFFLLAVHLARVKGVISPSKKKKLLAEFKKVPGLLRKIIRKKKQLHRDIKKYHKSRSFMYLGRNINYPTALEGALKLKEISYIHAEGCSAGEMKHGPIALVDEKLPTVCIAVKSSTYEKIISNIQEIKARLGLIIAVATEKDKEIRKHADTVIYVPKIIEPLSCMLAVVPLQLIAYFIAVERGCDVDKPRNLAKSVTVE